MLVYWSVDVEKDGNFQKEGGLWFFVDHGKKIGEKSQPPYFCYRILTVYTFDGRNPGAPGMYKTL